MRGVTIIDLDRRMEEYISTHTPHARRDGLIYPMYESAISISTHTPHARRDGILKNSDWDILTFQLTRLMRGVTAVNNAVHVGISQFQLTRLMRGVTLALGAADIDGNISTHTPHARRDSNS